MGETFEPVQLRPLGIGEIFDRAVTLYVRNFLLFAIISAFVIVPLSVANYFTIAQQAGVFAQILDQIQHPARNAPVTALPFSPWFAVVVLISLLFTPFMYVAMAAALGRIYNGEQIDWRGAYRIALRHAGSIIVTVICEVAMFMALAFAGVLALGMAFASAILFVRYAAALSVAMMILAGLLSLAYVIGLMLCYLSMALAFDAIGIEEVPFNQAISSSFARVFNRNELGKATLVCVAFSAVEFGLIVVSMVVSTLLEGTLHQPVLQSAFSALISIVTTGFIGVLVAVYYFDVRIRREGLDMQAAIDRLQTQP